MDLWKKLAFPPSPKKEIRSSQYGRSLRNLKFTQPLATRYKKQILVPTQKKIWVERRGEYNPIENEDTNTDYQRVFKSHLKKMTPA